MATIAAAAEIIAAIAAAHAGIFAFGQCGYPHG